MINQYKIISPLGAGGMGEVYRALDTRLGREVAIKLLPSAFSTDKDRLRRFEQEARAAGMLNHPNVLTIYDIGAHDGAPYIVSELLIGETLRERLRATPLAQRRAIDYALQVARGLAAAHEVGIVHRDLKPENLFVTKDGRVKILDFGLAKLKSGPADINQSMSTQLLGTGPGVVMGTAGYMSPEQVRAEEVDHRSDIFAFGTILYEMLTGKRAFERDSAVETLNAILKDEPAEISERDVSPQLIRVVRHCLEKNRDERFQSMADVPFYLEALPSTANDETSGEPSKPRGRARLWLALAAVGIVLAIVLTGAITLWKLRPTNGAWQNPLANAHIERVTDFEGTENDAAISPDGKFIVFLSDRDGTFDAWVNQVGSGAFVNLTRARFPELAHEEVRTVGFTADASHVWLRIGQKDPTGKDTHSLWLTPTMGGGAVRPFLENAVHAAWSPDGKRIVYHEFMPGDPTFVVDRDGSNPKQIFIDKPGFHCHHHVWSPDGHYIYFVRGFPPTEMDVWRISPDGGQPERITHHNSRVAYPAFLDNQTLIYSATAEDGSGYWLYAMDVEEKVPHRMTFGVDQYISVSAALGPDGRATRLVASVADPIGELWTIPLSAQVVNESDAHRFTLSVTRAGAPRFGPQYVVFLSSKGGTQSLWKTQNTETVELWRSSDGSVLSPAISPDGQRICFTVRRQGRNWLYVTNADGTNARQLAASLDVRDTPSWSPDGKFIAVAADEGDGSRLFKVPVDGQAPVRLVDDLSRLPAWSPDGSFILYAAPYQGAGYAVKAVSLESQSHSVPELWVLRGGDRYRFLPGGKQIVALLGDYLHQNFWMIELETGQRRQLSNLKPGYSIGSFDVSPDGQQILFDRVRQNSDIVLIDLARK